MNEWFMLLALLVLLQSCQYLTVILHRHFFTDMTKKQDTVCVLKYHRAQNSTN